MSIRIKLTIIMFAIGLIPALIVSAIAYTTTSSGLIVKTADQLSSIASNQQQKINNLLQKRQEDTTTLVNQFDLQSALGTYISSQHRSGADTLTAILLNKKTAAPDIQALYMISLDGSVIASTVSGSAGTKLAATDYFIPAGQETNISVKEDSRDGIDKLYITTKVNINKKESGYLNFVFRIDDIVAAVQDYTGLGATGETLIAAKNGNDGLSLFPLRFDTDAALKTKLTSLDLFTNDNAASYRQTKDYRGHPVIVTSRPIGFADWTIAAKIDRDEALAPIMQLRNALLVLVAVIAAGIIVLSVYFTRTFTQPILRVARVAENFGKGDFDARVDVHRNDEIGALAESVDATGRSLQELVTRLESQRNRLAIILNSTAESILAIDKEGKILLANNATVGLSQLASEEIVGKHISEIFNWQQDMEPFPIDYTKPGTNTYSGLQYIDASGDMHYVRLIVAQAISKQQEQAPQTIVTVHDQTKSRELENMKVDFVSMAAHELRTPLAATRGYLELIRYKEGEAIHEDTKNYLQQALKSTTELGNLINNLLGVTRIERDTLTLRPERVDLATDLQQAIQSAMFSATDKRIDLHYIGPESGCEVIADELSLHEVINNLIGNAIKYTEPGGTVTVLLSREDNNFVVSFKDTGIGIPKQALPNLFTKFYRVRGGLNSGSTGTGLGLFIAKSIIERHGGTISVTSQEGVGSTFTITLPVLDESRLKNLVAQRVQQGKTGGSSRGWTTQNISR